MRPPRQKGTTHEDEDDEEGELMYSKANVDRIVEAGLARERKRNRQRVEDRP